MAINGRQLCTFFAFMHAPMYSNDEYNISKPIQSSIKIMKIPLVKTDRTSHFLNWKRRVESAQMCLNLFCLYFDRPILRMCIFGWRYKKQFSGFRRWKGTKKRNDFEGTWKAAERDFSRVRISIPPNGISFSGQIISCEDCRAQFLFSTFKAVEILCDDIVIIFY